MIQKLFSLAFLLLSLQGRLPAQYRFYGGVSASYSYGSFSSGNTLDLPPNISMEWDHTYITEAKLSLDWQRSPEVSFLTNLGREYHISLGIERSLSDNFALSCGLELGGRSFAIRDADRLFGTDAIVVFRNFRVYSLPVQFIHRTKLGRSFFLRESAGFSLNIPETYSQKSQLYETRAYSPLYALAILGMELGYTLGNGHEVSATISYNQGFVNVIDDEISYDIRYNDTQKTGWGRSKVLSNGTYLSFGIRYCLNSFGIKPATGKKSQAGTALVPPDLRLRPVGKPADLKVDTPVVRVCVWDDQRIDGDSVSIEYKDSIIMGNIRLDRNRKCVNITAVKGQPNYLVIHALNEGRVKPNTVQVAVFDKSGERSLLVRTTMQTSSAINLQLE
jgi:hypothetical protein